MALLVPDDRLLRIALTKKYFDKRYESFFIRDKYSHLATYLHLMDPHSQMASSQVLLSCRQDLCRHKVANEKAFMRRGSIRRRPQKWPSCDGSATVVQLCIENIAPDTLVRGVRGAFPTVRAQRT